MITTKLKYCGTWRSGGTPPRQDAAAWRGAFPWASTKDLRVEQLGETEQHITEEAASTHSRIVPRGTILVSTRGMSLARRLPMALVTQQMAFNQDLKAIEPAPEINPEFLFYAIKAREREVLALVEEAAHGTKRLSTDRLREVAVDLPDPDEQARISRYLQRELTRLDRLETKKRDLARLLVQRRAAILRAAVSGRLTDNGERTPTALAWLDSLPASWPTIKLTLAARLGTGHTPSRSVSDYWVDCNIPWITTGEVHQLRDDRQEVIIETREKISRLGIDNSSAVLHPAGTVVLSRTASAGYSAIMGGEMATSQDFVTWTCSERLLPRFLLFCLRAMRPDLLGRLAMGSTHKTIYMPDVQMLRIPLPDIDEQVAALQGADAELARIDPLSDALERQSELLGERRQALIAAAVNGELDTQPAATFSSDTAA